jgi:hypothetical protein
MFKRLRMRLNPKLHEREAGYGEIGEKRRCRKLPRHLKPLKGLFGVIGIDFLPYQHAAEKFAMEPFVLQQSPTRTPPQGRRRHKLRISHQAIAFKANERRFLLSA